MEKDKVTLKIPRHLYKRLGEIIEKSGFRSVNEFVVYVLRDLASANFVEKEGLTKEEIEVIRKRLENLGYF